MKKRTKRILAVVFLAAFIFFSVFSAIGLVTSVHHNCTGIHCRTCEKIAVIENVVSMFKAAIIIIAVMSFVSEFIKLLAAKMPSEFNFFTAVTLKTKLSM